MKTQNQARVEQRVEFWTKDGYWHFVQPDGKWSAECYESCLEAWKASKQAWEVEQ